MVALADDLTQQFGLQADVTYTAAVAVDGAGKDITPGVPVVRKAIVNKIQKLVKNADGQLVLCQAYVGFLQPTPISVNDTIVLADGTTGPILSIQGFVDGSNGPILTEVYLGF